MLSRTSCPPSRSPRSPLLDLTTWARTEASGVEHRKMFSNIDIEDKESGIVGQRVLEIKYADDEVQIITDRGTWILVAQGDCCSQSFFLDFDRKEDLIGQYVLGIEMRYEIEDVPRDRSNDPAPVDERSLWYGILFTCIKGSAYLEMRNDSNGYYGGHMDITFLPNGQAREAIGTRFAQIDESL